MPLRPFLFLLLAVALLASCTEPREPLGLTRPSYFDLESLLAEVQQQLTKSGAGVRKAATAEEGQTEVRTLQQVNWQRELEFFSQAAINRPAWRDEFTADTSQVNGAITIRYRRKEKSNAPVEYLQVRQSAEGQPEHIEALVSSNNMLYFNSRLLELYLAPGAPTRLSRYQVKGLQKLILSDTVHYALQGEVIN